MAALTHEERHVIEALMEICDKQDIKKPFHVGAGDGYEMAQITERLKECHPICIEANPDAEPVSDSIQFFYRVIGATDCQIDFYDHENPNLSGHFPRGSKEKRRTVSQLRLDTFCNQSVIWPDALIIDTEGSTMDVLEGCGKILDDVRLIYAEVQSDELRPGIRTYDVIASFLADLGFKEHMDLPTYGYGGAQFNMTWTSGRG